MGMSGEMLFIFDGGLKLGDLPRLRQDLPANGVALLPLTSDFSLIDAVRARLGELGVRDIRYLDAAVVVDAEVDVIRREICDWAHRAGEAVVEGRKLKEWFYLQSYDVSSWWLSLLSEKNTLKTRAFLHIAQVRAIDRLLRQDSFASIALSIANDPVAESVRLLCDREKLPLIRLKATATGGLRERIVGRLQNAGWLGQLTHGALAWARLCAQVCYLRMTMGQPRRSDSGEFLFATYFPAYDERAAAEGRFANRYVGDLQQLFEQLKLRVSWLLMYVPLQGMTFRQAVGAARRFRDGGAKMFFPEQCLGMAALLRVLIVWARQAFLAWRLRRPVDSDVLSASPMLKECRPILAELWRTSFAGSVGLLGIAYLAMFREVWRRIEPPRGLAYICEMHAWEKALLGARRGVAEEVPTIAIQHTVVSRDYFHYFTSPKDMEEGDKRLRLPLPEFLATNGPGPTRLLASCRYPGGREVEALRYTHLGKMMRQPVRRAGSEEMGVLLVIGSFDAAETRALAHLVHAAFHANEACRVMLKSHPYTPFDRLLNELGIDWRGSGYQLVDGPVADYLPGATAVLVASSAVAVEAAILGKTVIVPRFADSIVMSPLDGLDGPAIKVVRGPDELRECWLRLNLNDRPLGSDITGAAIDYWHLDPELPRWRRLLQEVGISNGDSSNVESITDTGQLESVPSGKFNKAR
ncbi:MAG TPA: TIGR04326 family surface carbohydrate biosynthesis protein [Burkholderiales bacterium]|nr:TIGR04326 family surface carbohydrate biosynthesis protein [Burkholderiales bacterium]